jgi:hypothetical protein
MNRLFFLPFAVAILVGCGDKSAASNSPTRSSDTNAPAESQKALEVPADLKTDAFEYYGLGRTEPMKLAIKQSGQADKVGTQTFKLVKVENGVAEYNLESSDELVGLDTASFKVEKEGIRAASNATISSDQSTWELPAGLTPGKTWEIKTTKDSVMQMTGTNKVVGTQEVKTPVATYKDALLITVTASGTQGGRSFKLNSKLWLVKGRGTVKTEIESIEGKTTNKIVMEEVK